MTNEERHKKGMTNLEYMLENNLFGSRTGITSLCKPCFKLKKNYCCYGGGICDGCEFNNGVDIARYLSQDYKEKIKLTQFEYDLLSCYKNKRLSIQSRKILLEMHEKGHFKNINDLNMTIEEILDNCVVNENETKNQM